MVIASTKNASSREQAEARIATLWNTARAASYNVVAAKEIALKGSSRPMWHASGSYGHKWGTAIHDLLEIHSKRPATKLDHHARRLADELELGLDRVPELLATVGSVAGSIIWQRAARAVKRYSEMPFEAMDGSGGMPTLTRGVIDLVFREDDGWVIVDYKTDDLAASDLASALNYYDQQLVKYAEFWEEIVQEAVVERGIFFTRLGRYERTTLR